jgi:uncharacterized protein
VATRPHGFFEWDAAKARANLDKHGIDFADVAPVFEDDRAITMKDLLTAVDEQRFLTVGRDSRGRILVVAYTWRGEAIRVFSARKATARERHTYWMGDA